jgi:ADP-ribosylglycohydrolase
MIDNRALIVDLLCKGRIRMEDAPFLQTRPCPLPSGFDFDRVEGMLLGLAIGDALGNTTESDRPAARRSAHGEVRDYLPNPVLGGRPVGLPSDDTQLAFWTLERLIADAGLVPERVARRFCSQHVYGLGSAVREFLAASKAGRAWTEAGPESAGTGALMRIAPILVPHLREPSPRLWADAALAGMITHNDRASNAACVAFVHLLWECLRLDRPPDPAWWPATFCPVMAALEGRTSYGARGPLGVEDCVGPISAFASACVTLALGERWPTVWACDGWHSGAYLREALPSALYILARHAGDPEEAIVRAVNDTVDNDTIAAIVGAAVGALHGARALPRRWREGLLGRTGADDDGRVFELLRGARAAFWR